MITLQLIISTITIITLWLAGSESWPARGMAWRIALLNQVLWTIFILWSRSWGLFPLVFVLIFVYSRNLVRWYNARESDDEPIEEV